ncbi:AMP-binding protein [Streptomyces sp. NPDC048417]|uniref:AMP-binding protein n=1 Tax=Streptomyces sp. NPDC048417 TaxID=3155387 RepID=UPI00341C35CF
MTDTPFADASVADVNPPDAPAAGRLDDLLAEAARDRPDRIAIRAGRRELSFAALDRRVTTVASALHAQLPEPGATVAVAAVLDPDFAAAYYAVARAGHVVAVLNPLAREENLLHVLTLCEAQAAFVDADTYARLTSLRDRLPHLRHVFLIDSPPEGAAEAFTPAHADLDDIACLHFTSGTTGLSKGVRLTHRNLTVNAAQIAQAHLLDSTSVVVNQLPTYHPMHLNSAVRAQATQVLCAAPEAVEAVLEANRARATHLYSLPVRLARLASAPAADVPALTTVRTIASGGSALPVAAARELTARFGVPVIQGYGLAETSPLTHSDDPRDPVHGSVGRPLRGTGCRIVDPETRAVLAAGHPGEVEVRGPQVMKGYLGRPEGSGVGPNGWFATGDIGRIDDSGRLVIVDRIGDVFKCDNFLVAPSEVERVLQRHPLVREAVVLGLPDGLGGAVAAALVVLAPERADRSAALVEVLASVNAELAYYQQVRHAQAVDTIPRSANGKIQRRDLRGLLAAGAAERPAPADRPVPPPSERTTMSGTPFTVVNTFTLKDPGHAEEFERRFLEHVQWMRSRDGFLDHQAVRRSEQPGVYVNLGWWKSPDDFRKVLADPVFQEHAAQFHKIVDVAAAPSMSVLRAEAEVLADSARTVLLVEEFTVSDGPEAGQAFEQAYRAYTEALVKADGFGRADLARSVAGPAYTALTWWGDAEALRAAQAGPEWAAVLASAEVTAHPVTPVAGTRRGDTR